MKFVFTVLSVSVFLAAVVTTSLPIHAQGDMAGGQASAAQARGADNGFKALYTDEGHLIRPVGWRKWVYIGTPLTPNDMNNGKAAFPEFHNVYIDPESFATFERTGEFPDGTQIAKELVLVGSKAAVSGKGYFMGEFNGLEIAIKDRQRFKDEPGGWVYFSFGHKADYEKTAKVMPTESCNACHQSSAATDFVFTQYYPVLREAMPAAAKMKQKADEQSRTKMDAKAMQAAMSAMGEKMDAATDGKDSYEEKVFKWLAARKYSNFAADSVVHPSTSGPAVHGDVRTFFNKKLAESMSQGNDSHPIGSLAVKELFKDNTLIGWALAIKSKEDSGKGDGWYWYENLSTTDSKNPVAAGMGHVSCVGCHAPGKDFVRTLKLK